MADAESCHTHAVIHLALLSAVQACSTAIQKVSSSHKLRTVVRQDVNNSRLFHLPSRLSVKEGSTLTLCDWISANCSVLVNCLLCERSQRLDARQQTETESDQHTSDVARLQPANPVVACQSRRHCSRSWCPHRQPAVSVGSRRCTVSVWLVLLPTATTPTNCPIAHNESRQNNSPRICILSLGLYCNSLLCGCGTPDNQGRFQGGASGGRPPVKFLAPCAPPPKKKFKIRPSLAKITLHTR